MSKPWDGEQSPLTDDIARGNHVVPTDLAQDLERRLRHAEGLLESILPTLEWGTADLEATKEHLAAAKEADQ